MHTNVLLPLALPSLVWKPLSGEALGREDLAAIDTTFVQGTLEKLDALPSGDSEAFEQAFGGALTWSTALSDGSVVELDGKGEDTAVELPQLAAFARAAETVRLGESRAQLAALRRGLCDVVPAGLLMLFPWAALEDRLCGRPMVDVQLLKRHTQYSGVEAEAPHIAWFWTVLEELDQPQRRQFIKFAWAQERLPTTDAEFNKSGHTLSLVSHLMFHTPLTPPFPLTPLTHLMPLTPRTPLTPLTSRTGREIRMLIKNAVIPIGQSPDERFPRADTCFFNLELPAYTSLDVLRRQLTRGITLSSDMDGDAPQRGQGVLDDEEMERDEEEDDEEMEEGEEDDAWM
jgi:other hect domain ubiquitin protein ligase E3